MANNDVPPHPKLKRAWTAPTQTAAGTITQIEANDPTLDIVDLSNSAVFQMRSDEMMAALAKALAGNTVIRELILTNCAISDRGCEALASALSKNGSVCIIDLSSNCISSEGASALAMGLAKNVGVREINLMNQSQGRWTDTCLDKVLEMLEWNVYLLKIVWRLESRKSFAINKGITRNNEIYRRVKAGIAYEDCLPEALKGKQVLAGDSYYADARAKPSRPLTPLAASDENSQVLTGGAKANVPKVNKVLSRWPPAMAGATT